MLVEQGQQNINLDPHYLVYYKYSYKIRKSSSVKYKAASHTLDYKYLLYLILSENTNQIWE